MGRLKCMHCGDEYPDFDVAHVCSKGEHAPKIKMNDREVIKQMRDQLQPKGSLDVVIISTKSMVFEAGFITKCINEIERIPTLIIMGEEVSPLQLLAIQILKDAAYIK